MIFRKTLAAALVAIGCSGQAGAQDYPAKPVRFIVPFPAGGPTDVVSRALTAELAKALGQPVVVENIGGAGGSIGMAAVAKAAADGYTIGLATTGTHAVNPHLYGAKLGYNALRDFTPITLVTYVNLLVVHPAVPATSVAELVAYARANPQKVNFGSSGNGSTNHLSGELLKSLTGAPMVHIPYKGGAQALTDLVGGNTTFMFDLLSSSLPHVHAGRLRALAVSSGQRTPFAPRWMNRAYRAMLRQAPTCGSAW
jgi:tripartite-type tricarboxylate transporter receptor subunit TctC